MNKSALLVVPRWCAAAALAALAACATNDPAMQQAMQDAKGISAKQTCCKSLGEVIASPTPLFYRLVRFNSESRHFDFGNGLAPFVVYELPVGSRILEVESPLQLVPWASGGDGLSRYVAANVLFFDERGHRVEGTLRDRAQRQSANGGRALFHYFNIPDGAKIVVVTTDPSKHEVHESSHLPRGSDLPLVSKGSVAFVPDNVLPVSYRLANYGPVFVYALPTK